MPEESDFNLIRISSFVESTLLIASHGDQIALGKLILGYRLPSTDGHYISTRAEGRKFVKLKVNEMVLQVMIQVFNLVLLRMNLYVKCALYLFNTLQDVRGPVS